MSMFCRSDNVLAIMALALLFALGHCPTLTAGVALPNGEPDASCADLRLWLRADAGVRDAAGHSSTDADFSGSVATWSDQSARHFDLAAPPELAPSYVIRQRGAGNRPTVAFGGGRILARAHDSLHDHENSTTFLVLQIQRGRDVGDFAFCTGDPGGRHEALSFEHNDQLDAAQCHLKWSLGEAAVANALQFPGDGRFAVVILRAGGAQTSVEVQDGLGDALGANREINSTGHAVASNQCGQGYCLGGVKLDQPQFGFDGQIAEIMVYNRVLSFAERRAVVAYLRRKYELDVLDALLPVGTFLMQAEDFDGDWDMFGSIYDPIAKMCLGHRYVVSKDHKGDDALRRTVLITRQGKYSVWLRARDFGNGGGLRTTIGDKLVGVSHAQGTWVCKWQLAGAVDLAPGETDIAIRSEGNARRDCDAVLISPTVTTPAGVEEVCALAQRLRRAPSPGQLVAVFDDGRRIEGSLMSGWRGSGVSIVRDGPNRPDVRRLLLDALATDPAPPSDALLEFHNGDRMRGTICGFLPASNRSGQITGARILVQPAQATGESVEQSIAVETDWLRRIVLDTAGPPRLGLPRSLICRDGRVIGFRALRYSGDGVSALTDKGLVRVAYRELAEIAMQPLDAWDAYYRQLAQIDPKGEVGIVRLETAQGMLLTASPARISMFRKESEAAASTCLVQPAWSRTPIPVAWSSVSMIWRAPAHVVPLSLLAPQQVAQGGALGSSWTWQTDRNVAGGDLRSGGDRYLWGFGVHAPNRMVFRLPDSAQIFRSGLGIDAGMGEFGCIVAKVYVGEASTAPLFQSKPLRGSRAALFTGDVPLGQAGSAVRHLVLAVEECGDARPADADPLDIGDHADWLEPTLLLDPAKLNIAVAKYLPAVK